MAHTPHSGEMQIDVYYFVYRTENISYFSEKKSVVVIKLDVQHKQYHSI